MSTNIVTSNLFGLNNDVDHLNQNNTSSSTNTNETTNDNHDSLVTEKEEAFIKLSGYSAKQLRLIKSEIEQLILEKIKNLDHETTNDKTINNNQTERSVCYMKTYSIDKLGNHVQLGETGIAEGWRIPIYKNEYQNLLGLPFTEDHALAESLRIKRPRQECFNCLSTMHSVRDCPVRQNDERIAIHREFFQSQSTQSNEQMNLMSNRYTNDLDSNMHRGYVPGKISNELRQALGLRTNQLPPFAYLMRELGYPLGWLIEARVNKSKLAVHNGTETNLNNNENNDNSILNENDESLISKENQQDTEGIFILIK